MLRRQNTAAMSARPSAHGYIPRRLCEIYSACDINPIAARQKSPSPPTHLVTPMPGGISPARCAARFPRFFSRENLRHPGIQPCRHTGSAKAGFLRFVFLLQRKLLPNLVPAAPHRRGAKADFVRTVFIQCVRTSAAPSSGRAPPARYKSGFCSHCFYPMRANLRRPRFQSRPTGEVRRGAIGLP